MEHIKLPQNEKVNIQAFANMLDLKNLQNSYKIYWFYDCVLDYSKIGVYWGKIFGERVEYFVSWLIIWRRN